MNKIAFPIVAACVAIIIAGALWLAIKPDDTGLSPAMVNVDGAAIGGPFELTAHTGERMTSDALIDRPTLVYFGYTFCPDICPIDVQIMAETVDLLAERNIEVRPLFVTIDPDRDTAEELAYYAEALHPTMIALTGTEDEIRAAADAYKVYYEKVEVEGSAAGYLMNHTGYTYLMTPEKGLSALFRRGFSAEQIANDVEAVLNAP